MWNRLFSVQLLASLVDMKIVRFNLCTQNFSHKNTKLYFFVSKKLWIEWTNKVRVITQKKIQIVRNGLILKIGPPPPSK